MKDDFGYVLAGKIRVFDRIRELLEDINENLDKNPGDEFSRYTLEELKNIALFQLHSIKTYTEVYCDKKEEKEKIDHWLENKTEYINRICKRGRSI